MPGGGACVPGGVCVAGGHVCLGGVRGMHAPRHHKILLVNARPVRILLECILVF